MTKKKTVVQHLVHEFIGEWVVIFLINLSTQIESDEGVMDVPLVAEGLIVDADSDWVLMSNEEKTQFSLINTNIIGKIDTVDREFEIMPVNKRKPSEMN